MFVTSMAGEADLFAPFALGLKSLNDTIAI